MTSLAVQAQPGCEGLTFLPYLNGEKTPISDENARGVLFGLSYRHGINEIARSVMEGIMTDIMYTVPSEHDIEKVIVTADCVKNGTGPDVIRK